jgi:hypothetical protein
VSSLPPRRSSGRRTAATPVPTRVDPLAGQAADARADRQERRPGSASRAGICVWPQIPGLSPGGLGPHLTSSGSRAGFPPGSLQLARPVLPRRPPSSGYPSSGVLRFGPFGRRCPVRVPRRLPLGFPSPSATSTLALSPGGPAGVGPVRPGLRSQVSGGMPGPDRDGPPAPQVPGRSGWRPGAHHRVRSGSVAIGDPGGAGRRREKPMPAAFP